MDVVDCMVIGAGVVGLAVARALTLRGYETVVLEAERIVGSGISSRNSEVIHAGIYYPRGSLKAELCVEGRHQLYAYCGARHLPHRRCGKLIVAASQDQAGELEHLHRACAANGVDDLRMLSGGEAQAMEPALAAVAALESPLTGIIDSHAYMLSLQGEAEAHGAVVAFGASVTDLVPVQGAIAVRLGQEDEAVLGARLVVNAAGLGAARIADALGAHIGKAPTPLFYAKGSYFSLTGRSPFSRLIYPTPEPGGLGVHLTFDLAGQTRFGPDVEWVDAPEFAVDRRRSERFYSAIRSYWPGLPDDALEPGYAGVRPKLTPPGAPAADFAITAEDVGQDAALVNLLGIESPGLTASLAIAERVARMADERFVSG